MAVDMVVLPNVDGVARRHSRDMEVAMVVLLLLSRDMADTAEDTAVRHHRRVMVVLNISSRLPKVRSIGSGRYIPDRLMVSFVCDVGYYQQPVQEQQRGKFGFGGGSSSGGGGGGIGLGKAALIGTPDFRSDHVAT